MEADNTPLRFPVAVGEFEGSLEQLVSRVQRGDIDVNDIAVGEVTRQFRRKLTGEESTAELRDLAELLTLMARLVALKAQRVLPSGALGEGPIEGDDEALLPEDDAGRRLTEYRLFRAAAEALLADPAEEGARSFLGLVSPVIAPMERLRISPERLAAAFRQVLERLSESDPLPVGKATFSVDEKIEQLRQRLAVDKRIAFEEVFAGVESRLEAVACFLALLQLISRGEADVDQEEPFSPITVTSRG